MTGCECARSITDAHRAGITVSATSRMNRARPFDTSRRIRERAPLHKMPFRECPAGAGLEVPLKGNGAVGGYKGRKCDK